MTETDTISPGSTESRDADCSAWRRIVDEQPNKGDIVACRAEHREGGWMYWAGTVESVNGRYVTMTTRGERDRTFFITHDTLWMRLEKPNAPIHPPRKSL